MQVVRSIRVGEDGTATYERKAVLPPVNGEGARERVLESKRVDATVLEDPERGMLPILPPRCRCIRSRDERTVVVTEDPPQVRTITWRLSPDKIRELFAQFRSSGLHHCSGEDPKTFEGRLRTQREFRLAFPYLVKVFTFVRGALESTRLFYRNAPITSGADALSFPNIANCGSQYDPDETFLCLPNAYYHEIIGNRMRSIAEAIRTVEEMYWGSAWSEHWMAHFRKDAERFPWVSSPWAWEFATAADPSFITALPWRSTGWTLGDAIDGFLGDRKRATVFQTYEQRVLTADPWDGEPAVVAGIRVSPAHELTIGPVTVRIGDDVILRPGAFREIPDGGNGTLEWFSEAKEGTRFLKVRGVDAPIRWMRVGAIVNGIEFLHRPVEAAAPIVLDGITIEPGTRCMITDPRQWPGHGEGCLIVTRAQRDGSGNVHVYTDGGQLATVIGNGARCFPGLRILPKEDCDAQGNLRSGSYAFTDGSTISVGDRLWYTKDDRCTVLTVDRIQGMQNGQLFHTFLAADGNRYTFEHRDGTLASTFVRVADAPIRKAVCDGRKIRVGDFLRHRNGSVHRVRAISPLFSNGMQFVEVEHDEWIPFRAYGAWNVDYFAVPRLRVRSGELCMGRLVIRSGDALLSSDGTCQTIERFIGTDEGSVCAICVDGSTVALVERWALCSGVRPLRSVYARGRLTIRSRQRLRLRTAIGSEHAGTRFTVLGIVPSMSGAPPFIVCTNGSAFALTTRNASCFELRNGTTWRSFPDDPACYPTCEALGAPGANIVVGARVRYIGIDVFGDPEAESIARRTPATVISTCCSEHATCAFDIEIPGAGTWDGQRTTVKTKRVALAVISDFSLTREGFTRYFDRPKRAPVCVERGKLVGRDRHGQDIRIGDRVRVVKELASLATEAARELQLLGHVFTVVHAGRNELDTWLYLHSGGREIGREIRATTTGYDTLPPNLQKNRAWHTQIAFALTNNCERVRT